MCERSLWGPYACRSETARLSAVMLSVPGPELDFDGPPAGWLMDARPDLEAIRLQMEALAALYEREGVRVVRARPGTPPPPNFLFMRDLFFMTPEGAVLARMASEQRAGEERHAAEALSRAGVPILLTPRGGATFEGADALWLDATTVILGTGRRTNEEGAAQVSALLRSMGVEVEEVPLPPEVQHLLGLFNPIDERLAAVDRKLLPLELGSLLERRGWRLLELERDDELVRRRSLNFVTLAPGRVMMPAGCPATRARYEAAGVACVEADVSEYVKAAGAIGCLTGILSREG